MPITKQVVPTPRLPTCEVTAFRLSRLIQNGELVCNEIITSYYEVICRVNSGIFYMDTTFLQVLLTEEWSYVARRFHGERRRSNDPHHIGRPRMEGENAIIIPIHYQENHWINVTRREQTPGEVTFFYADNLNCPHTAQYIESTFCSRIRDHRFMPTSAKWIICKQMHYDQHFMERGPRMLLAGTILAYHPEPTENSLLPLMHPNLSNIARTWVASTIVSQSFQYSAIRTLLRNQYHSQIMEIPLNAHAINEPIIHLPSVHSFTQQNSKPKPLPCSSPLSDITNLLLPKPKKGANAARKQKQKERAAQHKAAKKSKLTTS